MTFADVTDRNLRIEIERILERGQKRINLLGRILKSLWGFHKRIFSIPETQGTCFISSIDSLGSIRVFHALR